MSNVETPSEHYNKFLVDKITSYLTGLESETISQNDCKAFLLSEWRALRVGRETHRYGPFLAHPYYFRIEPIVSSDNAGVRMNSLLYPSCSIQTSYRGTRPAGQAH